MGIGAGLASAKFAFLSWLSATSGTTNRGGFFLLGFHIWIMRQRPAADWSILTSGFTAVKNPFLVTARLEVRASLITHLIMDEKSSAVSQVTVCSFGEFSAGRC